MRFQLPKRGGHPVQDLADFAERGLLVVERVEQPQDERCVRPNALKELPQPTGDGGFHLVAGKPPGDEDAVEHGMGVERIPPRDTPDQVHVEAISPVDDGNGGPLHQGVGGNGERQGKHRRVPVQEEQFSRRRTSKPIRQRRARDQ